MRRRGPLGWTARVLEVGRWLTVHQWRLIDAQYQTRSGFDVRAASVLITAACVLVVARYSGKPEAWEILRPGLPWLDDLAYPELHRHLFWALNRVTHYCVLPYLCTRLILRERVAQLGVRLVFEPRVLALYAAMATLAVALAHVASSSHSFLAVYPKYPNAGNSVPEFLLWETAYGLQFAALEFFFRGFLIFSLARHIGSLAIFVMVVPYAMIHFSKPFAECLGSILAGTALGTIALRTGSIWGGVAVHCVVAWSMDVFALGRLGRLCLGGAAC